MEIVDASSFELYTERLIQASDYASVERLMDELDKEVLTFNDLVISQNLVWHKYTVKSHIIYTVLASDADMFIRWAALLHDVGKREAHSIGEDGKDHFYNHAEYSVKSAERLLEKLECPEDIKVDIVKLVELHDIFNDWSGKTSKVRELIGLYGSIFVRRLVGLSWADCYSQSEHAMSLKIPELQKIMEMIEQIEEDGSGINENELALTGEELHKIAGEYYKKIVEVLLKNVWGSPRTNNAETLAKIAKREVKKLKNKKS